MDNYPTNKGMTRISRPAIMTIRGQSVSVSEYETWQDKDTLEEFEDEGMIERNLDAAWAAYWSSFSLSDLLTMREDAIKEISAIDRALAGAGFSEKMEAAYLKIDRAVLARFQSGDYPACSPSSQWWWHRAGEPNLVQVSANEFDSIKRLTDKGILIAGIR